VVKRKNKNNDMPGWLACLQWAWPCSLPCMNGIRTQQTINVQNQTRTTVKSLVYIKSYLMVFLTLKFSPLLGFLLTDSSYYFCEYPHDVNKEFKASGCSFSPKINPETHRRRTMYGISANVSRPPSPVSILASRYHQTQSPTIYRAT
jgi:hypothetical protein